MLQYAQTLVYSLLADGLRSRKHLDADVLANIREEASGDRKGWTHICNGDVRWKRSRWKEVSV